jgi:hypothetical protein
MESIDVIFRIGPRITVTLGEHSTCTLVVLEEKCNRERDRPRPLFMRDPAHDSAASACSRSRPGPIPLP